MDGSPQKDQNKNKNGSPQKDQIGNATIFKIYYFFQHICRISPFEIQKPVNQWFTSKTKM